MSEPGFEVVWPLGKTASEAASLPPRLDELKGKVFAELWNWLYKGDQAFPIIREEIARRYPGASFIPFETFGNIFGAEEGTVIARLPELLRQYKCDGVIAAIGH